jgi:hypothetical protein
MSDSDFTWLVSTPPPVSVAELARQQGVRPIPKGRDMRLDIWGSDEAFDAFMEDLRASRQADLA